MLVIGSHALRIGLEEVGKRLNRAPSDLDILAWPGEADYFILEANLTVEKRVGNKWLCRAPDGRWVEIEIATTGSSSLDYLRWEFEMTVSTAADFYGVVIPVAPLEMLYSLKRAHRHSPRMFHKHVKDYNLLREIVKTDALPEITKKRYQETVEREKLRTPSLNKSTKDFFDDKVSNRTFIHDQIHEVMAFGDRPMFEKIKIDPNKVACSKEKFFALTHEERAHCVQEEVYVIALERAIIPMLFEGEGMATPVEAYKWALMRICTTLCSGWFREFALENYEDLMLRYNWTYTNKFLKAVEEGRIRRIEK
jgi:hypothetical protein